MVRRRIGYWYQVQAVNMGCLVYVACRLGET